MSAEEISITRWGEFLDLIACYQIEQKGAKPKKVKRQKQKQNLTMEQIIFEVK